MPDITNYPSGNVTFVFTDIEGSTKMNNALGSAAYNQYLRDPHREKLLAKVKEWHGHEVHRAGDGHLFIFQQADDALACVVAFQEALVAEPIRYQSWQIKVRIGVHTALQQRAPQVMENGLLEYSGEDTNFAARIGDLGKGGQIIISAETRRVAPCLAGQARYALHKWPARHLKSFDEAPEDVWEILYAGGEGPCEPGMRFFPAFYVGEANRYIERPEKQNEVLTHFSKRRSDGTTARLVTVKAEGGMGKTRLAIACAVRLVGAFKNHAHFVNLAPVSPTVEAVCEAIGQELGLKGAAAQPDALFEALRERDALLVLDNYESAACEAVADYLARLVTHTPRVCLLVTGRRDVGKRDIEQLVHLEDGMPRTQARELFLARAALRWGHNRVLSADEEAQLRRILHLTSVTPEAAHSGSIPLAGELAAAWVEDLSLREIADDLEQTPLGDMTEPPPDSGRSDDEITGGRHRSLRRSLTWSYNLLGKQCGEAVQQMFAASGLFAETFDAATLGVITNTKLPDARKSLIRLHQTSLVRRVETPDGSTRYRLHRFTRAYALLCLGEWPEADAIRQRFVAHYVQLVEGNRNLNDLAVHAVLENEWRNIAAAQVIAHVCKNHGAVVLLSLVSIFLALQGFWSEEENLQLVAVDAARDMRNPHNESIALNNLGMVYDRQDNLVGAITVYEQSLLVCRNFGDRAGEGCTLNNLGLVYRKQERWDKAISALEQALVIKREFEDHIGEGATLSNLGITYADQGNLDKAVAALEQGLAIFREFNDHICEGQTLNNLGAAYKSQSRWNEAVTSYEQSLLIRRKFKDRIGEGQTLRNLALLWEARGDVAKALPFARQAVAVLEGTQAAAQLAKARETLAWLEAAQSMAEPSENLE